MIEDYLILEGIEQITQSSVVFAHR